MKWMGILLGGVEDGNTLRRCGMKKDGAALTGMD